MKRAYKTNPTPPRRAPLVALLALTAPALALAAAAAGGCATTTRDFGETGGAGGTGGGGGCGPGTTMCGDACVDTTNNPAHCGGCDVACPAGQQCVAGHCGVQCGVGTTQCGNVCADTTSDPAHCGICDNACPGLPNAVPTCDAGMCGTACMDLYADCNGAPDDGCETPTSSLDNCGGCGNVCPPPDHAEPACVNGQCQLGPCELGYADCDNDPATGCEANLSSDAANCGACGVQCPSGQQCSPNGCQDAVGCYGPLNVAATISLAPAWSSNVDNNFHPQGFTFDEAAGNFVFALQGPASLRVVSLTGALLNTVTLSQAAQNVFTYMTGIAADSNYYYLSDYTCNSGCPDLFRVPKSGGMPQQISMDLAAFGGYPLALGNGKLYRGELISNTYDWSQLSQIRVADVGTPDTITATLATGIARGIGDLTWDGSALWALAYSHADNPNTSVDLYRIDPNTGAILESYLNVYNPLAPYNPSGLAYAQGSLYVFDYSESSSVPSRLTRIACN